MYSRQHELFKSTTYTNYLQINLHIYKNYTNFAAIYEYLRREV